MFKIKRRVANRDELFDSDIKKMDRKIENFRENLLNISNTYNYIIYSWMFLLNTGGLVGALALVNGQQQAENSSKGILTWLFILFFLGLLSVMIAAALERYRFKTRYEKVSKGFKDFKEGEISKEYFLNMINNDIYLCGLIWVFELCSIVLFAIGFVMGLIFFV